MNMKVRHRGGVSSVHKSATIVASKTNQVGASKSRTQHKIKTTRKGGAAVKFGEQNIRCKTERATYLATSAVAEGQSTQSSSSGTGKKKYAVITGASSGLGLNTAKALSLNGDYHIIMACRDFAKGETEAKNIGMKPGTYTVMHLDLSSLNSVRIFAENYKKSGLPLDALVCNAAVYLPSSPEPSFTPDGFEMSVGTNHLGHFLLCNLLMDDVAKSNDPRIIIVGSVTGNTNTVAGQVPPKADLGNLQGLEAGLGFPNTMIDGGDYDGAKAYKDSKVCNMLTMREMHKRFHKDTGIVFGSMYPGCIAETNLFRDKRAWFRWLFPRFMKYVTKGYVSQVEAGERLAQVVSDDNCKESGVYWSWNGAAKSFGESSAGGAGGLIFENEPSEEVTDDVKAERLWNLSMKAVGLGN